jgi:HEAT repeat protein
MDRKSCFLYRLTWLLAAMLMCIRLTNAQPLQQPNQQSTQKPTQEYINKRIAQVITNPLQQGVFTTSSGVRATLMRADISLEESTEIKQFGERAIAPLTEYLHSPDYRAQHLAVRALGSIGGKNVVKPLSYAAQESESAFVRLAAVANLAQHPWVEIADTIQHVASTDLDSSVKKEVQAIIDKHQSAP